MNEDKNCGNCLFSNFKTIEKNLIDGYKLGRDLKKSLKKVMKDKKLPSHVRKEAEILLAINKDFIKKKLT